MNRISLFLVSLYSLALLILPTTTNADHIYVNGNVFGTWSVDTVFVTGEIRIPPGETLTIEPGVEVLFQVYCKFIVDNSATLLAVGTETDLIRFDELIPDTHWGGIRFLSASNSSQMQFCQLQNGLASGSGAEAAGGAIYCFDTNLTISHCVISGNGAFSGGAIYCSYADPIISHNLITSNYRDPPWGSGGGGGIYCYNSNALIYGNIIADNTAGLGAGGGIRCENGSPAFVGNIITGNSSPYGGGVDCDNSSASIRDNIISQNSSIYGGGILCYSIPPTIRCNLIIENSAEFGGGLKWDSAPGEISHNCFWGNTATTFGGGLFCQGAPTLTGNTFSANAGSAIHFYYSEATLINCILWDDFGREISLEASYPRVSYSDVQGGFIGFGNINANPRYVNVELNDYRLNWNSPCIDSGNPNPQYNDPDSTRVDMGAFFFDQRTPLRILLSPHEIPYLIPENGGSMDFTIRADNWDSQTHSATIWCDVALPDSSIYGPLLGPVTITINAGQTLTRIRTQNIPALAQMGVYHYNAYAVVGMDTSKDSFIWGKLGMSNDGLSDWSNFGENFTSTLAQNQDIHHSSFLIPHSVNPNPFNPSTTISFELPKAGEISLIIYDIRGREVASLLTGHWAFEKQQQVIWNAEGLPSGIYFARLEAGEFTQTQKLLLMK